MEAADVVVAQVDVVDVGAALAEAVTVAEAALAEAVTVPEEATAEGVKDVEAEVDTIRVVAVVAAAVGAMIAAVEVLAAAGISATSTLRATSAGALTPCLCRPACHRLTILLLPLLSRTQLPWLCGRNASSSWMSLRASCRRTTTTTILLLGGQLVASLALLLLGASCRRTTG